MRQSGSGKPSSRLPWPRIYGGAGAARWAAAGMWMRPRMRTAASSLFYWVLVVIVPFPRVLAFLGAEVELRAARGALANLVSGGTASTPRSHVRVGGAPRRAVPLSVIGAVGQLSYRDLERMLADRGVVVDHTTLSRWVQRFAPELEKRMRRHLRPR